MRSSFVYVLAVTALLGATLGGCKKKSPLSIDNNSVILKPYTLYVTDTFGAIYHTNDGIVWDKVPGMGSGAGVGPGVRAITISDTNIIYVRIAASVSDDRGKNFNPISPTIGPNPNTYWQSMVMPVPAWNRVYMATGSGSGVAYSDSNGRMYTWVNDGSLPSADPITSFTVLRNGTLIGLAGATNSVYKLSAITQPWQLAGSGTLPAGQFHLTHFEDMVIAADYTGAGGVHYSTNNGGSWTAYTGIPPEAGRIYCLTGVFDQAILVGTEKMGIFRVEPTRSSQFTTANLGLLSNLEVKGLTTKTNIYKNESVKQYVFASTNKGVFVSEDLGKNWVQVFDKNCTAIY